MSLYSSLRAASCRCLLSGFLATALLWAPLAADTLVREEAGQLNAFLNDGKGQVHLLHRNSGRTIFAFPSENSGVGLWFGGKMQWKPGSLHSLEQPHGQTVQCEFTVTEPVTIDTVLLDNIRVLRAQTHGEDTPRLAEEARDRMARQEHLNPHWAHPVTRFAPGQLTIERYEPSFGLYRLVLESPSLSEHSGTYRVGTGPLKVSATCPFAPMPRMTLKELLRPAYYETVNGLSERERSSLQALEFLTSQEKMMAGSWRFLTYFGRDTLISLSMLEPILSDDALTNGVQSVLRRLSPQGAVAHEEDIGSWAEYRHLQESPPRLSLKPVYDYKMIDDDLLLPVLLAKLEQTGHGSLVEKLVSDSEAREALTRNLDYNLARLRGKRPLLLNPGEKVGEWRDSEEGLGGGVDPYSVNGALTVPALRAMHRLYQRLGYPDKAAEAQALVANHQTIADRFWQTLSKEQLHDRLQRFAATRGEREREFLNRRWQEIEKELPQSVELPVLSFNADGTPNLVAHSDVCFNLFYGELSDERLDRILKFLELPFPVGLITRAGPIVANPGFSTNPLHYKTLGPGQYHGMVVWSWQSAMLQLGLVRQLQAHPDFGARIRPILARLAEGEKTAGALGTSELWGISFEGTRVEPRAYGEGGDQTESNVLQLWSTVYPAVVYSLKNI